MNKLQSSSLAVLAVEVRRQHIPTVAYHCHGTCRDEGAADGGIIVQDCLQLTHSLLRKNASNQRMFRCLHRKLSPQALDQPPRLCPITFGHLLMPWLQQLRCNSP